MAVIKVWMVFLITDLLLLLCSGLASDYITPGLSDPCPAKPCLTLLQFAKSQAASINTTRKALP